jgi:hypothetical protein
VLVFDLLGLLVHEIEAKGPVIAVEWVGDMSLSASDEAMKSSERVFWDKRPSAVAVPSHDDARSNELSTASEPSKPTLQYRKDSPPVMYTNAFRRPSLARLDGSTSDEPIRRITDTPPWLKCPRSPSHMMSKRKTEGARRLR